MSAAPPDGSDARRAMLDAAKALLPTRAPSTVSGRELAEAAGVNYGLVHHHFGTKDAVFRAALLELRAEFLEAHDDEALTELLAGPQPYLRALGMSQTDYPTPLGTLDDFPAMDAVVAGVRARLGGDRDDIEPEVKARAMAMVLIQLGRCLFSDVLHAAAHVDAADAPAVEAALAGLYREIAAVDGSVATPNVHT